MRYFATDPWPLAVLQIFLEITFVEYAKNFEPKMAKRWLYSASQKQVICEAKKYNFFYGKIVTSLSVSPSSNVILYFMRSIGSNLRLISTSRCSSTVSWY